MTPSSPVGRQWKLGVSPIQRLHLVLNSRQRRTENTWQRRERDPVLKLTAPLGVSSRFMVNLSVHCILVDTMSMISDVVGVYSEVFT